MLKKLIATIALVSAVAFAPVAAMAEHVVVHHGHWHHHYQHHYHHHDHHHHGDFGVVHH